MIWFKCILCICIGIALFSSCARSQSNIDVPTLPEIPESWNNQHNQKSARITKIQDIQQTWLQHFKDPQLFAAIQEALENNFELKQQVALWQQQHARARAVAGDKAPQLSVGLGASRRFQRLYLSGSQSTSFSISNLDATASASWEIDLWGRLSNLAAAAMHKSEASASEIEAMRLSITAQVAQAWYACMSSTRQIDVLTQTRNSWASTIASAERRFERGNFLALDLQRLKQAQSSDAALLTERKQELKKQQRDLELLLGRYPAAAIRSSRSLPQLATTPPAGQPSSLLERRYDIAAAQQRIHASQLQHTAAKKSLLPSFSLTAQYGYASQELNDVFKPESLLWNIISGLTTPIFQGDKLRAQVSQREAELLESYARYAQIALRALYEVENALSNETFIREKIQQLKTSEHYASKTYNQARQQFENGLFTMTDVLDMQRNLLNARIRLIVGQHALISNRISLHLALGGDFVVPQEMTQEKSNQQGKVAP